MMQRAVLTPERKRTRDLIGMLIAHAARISRCAKPPVLISLTTQQDTIKIFQSQPQGEGMPWSS